MYHNSGDPVFYPPSSHDALPTASSSSWQSGFHQQIPQETALQPNSNSTSSWQRRQAGGLRRYPTRRIKLAKGSVLSVDHAVPSAIINSVEPQYRDSGESPNEFTHLRCT
jgi:chitin synthase